MYTGKCLSPERSGIIGKSRDYNDYCCLCSTMRIGEARFEHLANVVSFRAPDFVPLIQFSLEKCIFLPQGDVVQNVTYGEK